MSNHIKVEYQWQITLVFVAPIFILLIVGLCVFSKKNVKRTAVREVNVESNDCDNDNNIIYNNKKQDTLKQQQISLQHIEPQYATNINQQLPQYDITRNDLFATKASLPRLSLPNLGDATLINKLSSSFQSTLAPEPKLLLPDTPPSILITNTDSPSFNLAHQKLALSPAAHPLAVPSTDTVMATLLGDIFLTKVSRTVELGTNSAGIIYKGVWQGAHVVLRPILTDKLRQLRDDVVILKNLRHPNIVIFFGLFQLPGEQEINVVTEFTEHGNLKDFLKSHNPDYIYKQQLVLFNQKKEAQQIRKEHEEILQATHFTISTPQFIQQVQQKVKEMKEAEEQQAKVKTTNRTSLPHSHSQSELSSPFRDLPDSITSPSLRMLTSRDLVKISRDIAAGMMQLEQKSFAHRNLSANSIVVGGSLPGNLIAKLSDFGLTRHIEFVPSPRWASPEALQSKRYTTRSDLWSYGITLYEIFTFGRLPYDDMKESEILNWVLEGNRLPFSSSTPPIIQTIAYRCWDLNLARRPTFDEIFDLLDNYLHSPYFN